MSVRGLYSIITEGEAAFKKKFKEKIEVVNGLVNLDSGIELVNPSNYKELIPKE